MFFITHMDCVQDDKSICRARVTPEEVDREVVQGKRVDVVLSILEMSMACDRAAAARRETSPAATRRPPAVRWRRP